MTYLNDPTVQANFDQVLSLNIELSTLQQDYQNSQSVFDNMDTFSELDRTLYDAVNNPAVAYSITVADYSFDRATGVLILNCSGPSSLSASTYMEALRTSNKFVAVSYIGYSGADNNYAFTATLQVIKGMEVSR